jgi:uncharacterized protein
MTDIILYLLLGLIAGILSGLIGIGGGILIVPVLVLLFGYSQHQAQGTSLAVLLLPIGLLAVWTYYQAGHVNIKAGALIAVGFFLGGLVGAKFATGISDELLQKIFGISLLLISIKMIFFK